MCHRNKPFLQRHARPSGEVYFLILNLRNCKHIQNRRFSRQPFLDINRLAFHHIKYRHEGLTFDCDQCDFKGASSGSLSRHTASIHEHRKFYCTTCDYKCSDSTLLKRHVISKHKLYACELCDFQCVPIAGYVRTTLMPT